MALFDKPFRYVPSEPAEALPGADVAVVDSVTPESEAPAPAAAAPAAAPASSAAAPVERVEVPQVVEALVVVEAPVDVEAPAMAVEAPVFAEPPAGVQPHVTVETPAVVETSVVLEAPAVDVPQAIAPVATNAEIIPHEEHSLKPADDPGRLIVFSRVVPSQGKASSAGDSQRLVSAIDEAEPVLDQLRSLAASLHQARTGRELKVIAVTSSVSGEGKTLLAANLALTLSRSYMRQVLMIDADLRRPNLHRLFGISSQEGIRTALDSVREGRPVAVQEVAPRLALLPAGKPVRDPISVLASDAMHRMMAGATAAFDWIVIDTPPVGMLPDVSLLSSLSDAVLLVVESGRVRFDLVQRTVESVGADRIFGVVLNKVPEKDIVAAYGMHYYAPYR